MASEDIRLERVNAPENLGISSQAVIKTVKRLEETMMIHSFMVLRHGKIAAECYRYPFRSDIAHTMYSVSKSITGTALGFAVSEGLVSLDTRLLDVFPEYTPAVRDEKLEKLLVGHLVTLTTGKNTSPLLDKTKGNWLRQFLDSVWVGEPGERFDYVNEAMYTVCAVVQRVTGQKVVDYLQTRLFEPLGIKNPFWETDEKGIASGGWGLYLKTEDLAKIAYCYLKRGKWGDKQVIPEKWAYEAVQPQGVFKGKPIDGDCYGYGVWVISDTQFSFRGMFDQFATAFIDEDTVIACTSCNNDEVPFWSALDDIKPELFTEENPATQPTREYLAFMGSRKVDNIPQTRLRSHLEKKLENSVIRFDKIEILNLIGFPISVINVAALFMEKYRAGNIDNVKFTFGEATGTFTWNENHEVNTVTLGLDGEYRYTPILLAGIPLTAAACAFWTAENELEVWIRPVESVAKRILRFSFRGNCVHMKPLSDPSMQTFVDAIAGTVEEMSQKKLIKAALRKALHEFKELLEHEHSGRLYSK